MSSEHHVMHNVMIEFRPSAVTGPDGSPFAEGAMDGLEIDTSYAPVTLPGRRARAASSPFDLSSELANDFSVAASTSLIRGRATLAAVEHMSQVAGVVGVFSDPQIEVCAPVCPGSPAVGDDKTVEKLLCVSSLGRLNADGHGVLVAIVDTGINMAYLNAHGKNPGFDAARSWVPRAGLTPGAMPVNHGTMCAFDVCIAAPKCTLLDIALLSSNATGPTVMSGLLSDAVRAYSHLLNILRGPRRPGDFSALVVNNSWGMFHPSWDFPVGHSGNYSDNPNHPFNLIVGTLERAGADILFAAGNCGADCPDGRCQGVTSRAIYGANSHPQVLTVAGVDTTRVRAGYSSQGPGRLTRAKPDICGYTHFRGSGVYAADGGTSAATPVVAGVLAAVRSVKPYVAADPTTHPAAMRSLLTSTAVDLGTVGFDYNHGYGVVDGCKLATKLTPRITPLCKLVPEACPAVPINICKRYPWICEDQIVPRWPEPIPEVELKRLDALLEVVDTTAREAVVRAWLLGRFPEKVTRKASAEGEPSGELEAGAGATGAGGCRCGG